MTFKVTEVAEFVAILKKHSLRSHIGASLKYFTTWVALLVLAYVYSSEYIDFFFLTSIVLFVSSIFIIITPGYIKYNVDSTTYLISGNACLILNIVFHVVPFLIVASIRHKDRGRMGTYPGLRLGNAFLLLLIYIVAFDVRVIYDANGDILAILTAFFLILYSAVVA